MNAQKEMRDHVRAARKLHNIALSFSEQGKTLLKENPSDPTLERVPAILRSLAKAIRRHIELAKLYQSWAMDVPEGTLPQGYQ